MRHHSSSGSRQARTHLNHALVTATLLAASLPAGAQEQRFNMTRGATELSQQVFDLHMTIFYICVVIAAIVSIAMVLAVRFWRTSKNPTAPVPAA